MTPSLARPLHLWLVVNGKQANLPELRQGVEDLRGRDHRVDVRVTWEAGDAERFARDGAAAGADTVVACGGDGTINAVANGLLAGDGPDGPAMAIVPLGTANDFAEACGLTTDMPRALQRVPATPVHRVDAGRVGRRFFMNVATGGFGSQVTAETPEELKRVLGGAAYFVTGMTRFNAVEPVAVRVTGPEFEWCGDLLVLALGNGRRAGGGHELCPRALIDDGLLDLALLAPPEEGEWRGAISALMGRGRKAVTEAMTTARLPWIEVEADAGLNINLDGEPMAATRFRFEAVPEALRLHLPDDSPLLTANA